ncbi:hypothetical protein ACFYXV_02155 [Streptomyces sp. NPDC002181]|uniref:hypothetical protein n=1 Tax=Streptomyces sp. NPDC002181 TaxID=3364635 RepID=UPI003682BE20
MPRTPRSPRRRRLAIAAAVANGAGTAAGTTAHFMGCDPDTSVSVGVLVSATVGDLLKQWASAEAEDPADTSGTDTPEHTPESGPHRPAGGAGRDATTPSGTRSAAPGATGSPVPAIGQARRPGRAGRRHARCAHPPAPAGTVPAALPLPRAAPAAPRHAGHRHLHRGAQKFVRRAHGRARPGREVTGSGGEA